MRKPFESRLSKLFPESRPPSPDYNGQRVIIIPLPEDYEGPGFGEECEFRFLGESRWYQGKVLDDVLTHCGVVSLYVRSKSSGERYWTSLDRIRHPQPKTNDTRLIDAILEAIVDRARSAAEEDGEHPDSWTSYLTKKENAALKLAMMEGDE